MKHNQERNHEVSIKLTPHEEHDFVLLVFLTAAQFLLDYQDYRSEENFEINIPEYFYGLPARNYMKQY